MEDNIPTNGIDTENDIFPGHMETENGMEIENGMRSNPEIEVEEVEYITMKDVEIYDFGEPDRVCPSCGAILWYEERYDKSKKPRNPTFSICCLQGKVKLPLLKDAPDYLKELLDYKGGPRARKFRENIRSYNSMFAFTSMGGCIDNSINRGGSPYIFKLNGQNHHKIGSLLPIEGETPKFAQLYIYDSSTEISNRKKAVSGRENSDRLDTQIIEGLMKMIDENNELAKVFRMARERYQESELVPIRLRIIGTRQRDGRQYNLPTSSEIAALIVENSYEHNGHRDIIVEGRETGLQRINELHPSFMAMQYPLLFPYADDGYRLNILYNDNERGRGSKRKMVSMREYYAFRIQQRSNEGQTLVKGGRLFQQYLVDAYTCIEENRLQWVRTNQTKIRAELYKGLQDAVVAGDTTPASVGKRVVLPSSFTGGPRYMIQHYQDAIAICRVAGPPDLFLTFTCNSKWNEIEKFLRLTDKQRPEDRPDIISRVFMIKLNQFMKDLRRGEHFGRVIAAIYTIEFQKRGLPHAHILLWLHPEDKAKLFSEIDKFISAELADKTKDPVAYDAVVQFMMHGACGEANPDASCMVDKKCPKHFPKKFCSQTTFDKSGFPIYRRRNDGRTAMRNGFELDNRWVIPYNRDLLIRYQAHINVELCNQTRSVKYLFKYISKGKDRATAVVEENVMQNPQDHQIVRNVDEVKHYLDCRYISASEAAWRIFNFDIHYRDPSVERLPFHLPDEQQIFFHDHENLANVISRTDPENTKFLKWMKANMKYEDARELTYADFPTKWVWKQDKKEWERRQNGNTIGRLYYAHPTSGERFYLRMLLNIVKGPFNFEDIRSTGSGRNKIVHPTFKEACKARGLLEDDYEWHEAIKEAGTWSTGSSLRQMFVTMLLFCELTDPLEIWNRHWNLLSDDILRRQRIIFDYAELELTDEQLKNYTLQEIENVMSRNCRSLKEFPMLPFPITTDQDDIDNRLIREEISYDQHEYQSEFLMLQEGLNSEQRNVFDAVMQAVEKKQGGLFFVYGSGGTGKTYLWKTIISALRANRRIALAVASSGIASLLLPGGRTAHSRFKIPINLDETACCDIKQNTKLAELICRADLIIWDEEPMMHRYAFEALDRTLRDVLRFTTNDSNNKVFGGKTLLLGGDFRQILPVIQKGSREMIVDASINRSELWKHFTIFMLTKNMRLMREVSNPTEHESITEFSKWVLSLGDGDLEAKALSEGDEKTWIKIPEEYLIPAEKDCVERIVSSTYPNLMDKYVDKNYLRERCILAPTNESVDEINEYIISSLPGDLHTFRSCDSISPVSKGISNQDVLYPVEFLNTLQLSGLPNHEIKLKVGLPIMLLRNINQSIGLCNGTRLIVTQIAKKVIEAEIITGNNVGNRVFIPRIVFSPSDSKLPFVLRRRQFPIRVCFAMTINKSQGQSIQNVGIYLPRPVFCHGQLYVAVSRTTRREGLKILVKRNEDEPEGYTQNIVYKEIFNNLNR